jgi:ligand-binding sensor domain-containing protein
MKRYLLFSFFFILAGASLSVAAVWEWTTFADARDIRQMIAVNDTIWCATNGGVVCFDIKNKIFKKYTNTDGLASNDIVAIERNQNGLVWTALADGRLNIMNPLNHHWDIYRDPSGQIQVINDILAYGDSVFVASNVGLSLMKLDDRQRWEIPWTAKIGPVRRIAADGKNIWVVLEESVKRIALNHPNPQAPTSWVTFDFRDGLPISEYISLFVFQDKLFVGSLDGLIYYDGSAWHDIQLSGKHIVDFMEQDGLLLALTEFGVYQRNSNGDWGSIGEMVENGQCLAVVNSEIWIGVRSAGLAHFQPGPNSWQFFIPDGPGSNKISDLAFDHDGELWGTCRVTLTDVSRQPGGIFHYDGKRWRTFCKSNGFTQSDDYVTIAVDSDNRIWAGSWGGGMTILEKTGQDSVNITDITAADQKLSGILADPNYIVVRKIVPDNNGYVWLLNYKASDSRVMAVVDIENDEWQYFTTMDGLGSDDVSTLVFDQFGRKWIGTDDHGIAVYDDHNTPFDKSDDESAGGLSVSDGLVSQTINALAFDKDGVMWIGTPDGLNYWYDDKVGIRYNVINDYINSIYVDVRNNKWFGTSGGLSMLDADGYTWTHFSTSNSPLVADIVTSFAQNDKTGDLFIGTTNGISRLETPFTQPAKTLSMLKGYPNPFILQSDPVRFTIENLTATSAVRIFTADGLLVKYIPNSQILGSHASWDGRNDQGNLVASGIYVFLVTDDEGMSNVGKVAVIRP